ncbi:MAG: polysaccharide biosynthesis protein [Proteobacteria bacterium]|nr:polysaccharide biosynthesis protein [Pseudomonadota bacterium]
MNRPDMVSLDRGGREKQAVADRPMARLVETTSLTPAQRQDRSIICRTASFHPQVDAFRDLRTRLLAIAAGHNITTVVAPVSRGSGASFVARNLAATFAFDEAHSALLIDCDLQQPSQHTTMRIDPQRGGLVDYLDDPSADIEEMFYETGIARLRLIPVGARPSADFEYFTSFRMRLLIDSLRNRYPDRYLFLDSPPVRGAPDARLLADLADMVVLVAAYGHDTPQAIAQAAANFDPEKFAGVVFNEGV